MFFREIKGGKGTDCNDIGVICQKRPCVKFIFILTEQTFHLYHGTETETGKDFKCWDILLAVERGNKEVCGVHLQ